ncbi:MAG: hypothetical protein MI784_16815 [Cytophagales bacterium]|nr:hypothetical protein [Cytophagales bacterium]
MERWLVISFLIIAASSCSLDFFDHDAWQLRTNPKGKHSAKIKVKQVTNSKHYYRVVFDETARYDLGNANQMDLNKLFGVSGSFAHHHSESARIAWRWNVQKEKIEIFSYLYLDGTRVSEPLGEVAANEPFVCGIELTSTGYRLFFNQQEREYKASGGAVQFRYMLHPYFGGDETAPHDIHIRMKRFF